MALQQLDAAPANNSITFSQRLKKRDVVFLESLPARVDEFKVKYKDKVALIVQGLREADIHLEQYFPLDKRTERLDAAEALQALFSAVDGTNPHSFVFTSDGTPPAFAVSPLRGSFEVQTEPYPDIRSEVGAELTTKSFGRKNALVEDYLPTFRTLLEDKIMEAQDLGDGKPSDQQMKLAATYVQLGELIDGFKKDYVPLVKDIKKATEILDTERERAAEENRESAFRNAIEIARRDSGKAYRS